MAKEINRIEELKQDIIEKMENVGMYNDSYLVTIGTLARTIYDYENAVQLFEETGGNLVVKHTNKNGSTNLAKNPIYLSIEKLRTDIFAFSKELGLTPNTKRTTEAADTAGKKLMAFLNE